jgi:hypothetical protein
MKPERKLIAVLLVVTLAGCGTMETTMRPEIYPRIPPNLKLVPLNSVALDAKCSSPGGMTDDGVALLTGAHYRGCYYDAENAIYYDPYNPCIKHELCHASGRSLKDCASVVCEK